MVDLYKMNIRFNSKWAFNYFWHVNDVGLQTAAAGHSPDKV